MVSFEQFLKAMGTNIDSYVLSSGDNPIWAENLKNMYDLHSGKKKCGVYEPPEYLKSNNHDISSFVEEYNIKPQIIKTSKEVYQDVHFYEKVFME